MWRPSGAQPTSCARNGGRNVRTLRVETSTIATSRAFEPSATQSMRPFGEIVTCRARDPTRTRETTSPRMTSSVTTSPRPASVTYACLPSGMRSRVPRLVEATQHARDLEVAHERDGAELRVRDDGGLADGLDAARRSERPDVATARARSPARPRRCAPPRRRSPARPDCARPRTRAARERATLLRQRTRGGSYRLVRRQRPLKSGRRFSTKALRPSVASSDARAR